MHNGADHISIEFHDQAKKVFFYFIEEFQSAANQINRRTQEYLFQESKVKFVQRLKQQLEIIATRILRANNSNENINEIDQMLQRSINSYLHQFVQKISAT